MTVNLGLRGLYCFWKRKDTQEKCEIIKDSEWYYHCFKKKNTEKAYRSSVENWVKDVIFIQKRRGMGKWDGENACILEEEKQEKRQCQSTETTWDWDNYQITSSESLSLFYKVGIIFVSALQNYKKEVRCNNSCKAFSIIPATEETLTW